MCYDNAISDDVIMQIVKNLKNNYLCSKIKVCFSFSKQGNQRFLLKQ